MLSRARRAVATFLFPTGAELVRCRLWVKSGLDGDERECPLSANSGPHSFIS